jgi:hypothetical protein
MIVDLARGLIDAFCRRLADRQSSVDDAIHGRDADTRGTRHGSHGRALGYTHSRLSFTIIFYHFPKAIFDKK